MTPRSPAGHEQRDSAVGERGWAKARVPALAPYATAVMATLVAIVLTFAFWPDNRHTIFAFYYLAVIVAAIYGHARAAILAVALSLFAVNYIFLKPHSYALTIDSLYFLSFSSLVAGAIILLIENLKARGRRLQKSEQEQRDLAEQLAVERARLVAAQAVAKVGSWETNLATLAVVWSAETYRIFGVAEILGGPTHAKFLQWVHPDDRAAVDAAFAQSLDQSSPGTIAHRIVTPEGEIKYVEERWRVVRDAQGRPVRATGTCQDITERKQAEVELREKDALIRIAGRLTRTGGWAMSVADQRVFWSDEICDLLECPRGNSLPLADALAVHPNPSRAQVTAAMGACVRGGTPFDLEVETVTATGRSIWGRVCGEAERDADGSIHRVQGAFQDITERKQAESARFEREQEFEAVVENAPDIVSRYDRGFRHLYVNQVIARATGLPASAFIGKTHDELGMPHHLQTKWHAVLEDVFTSGQERETEFEFPSPAGPRSYHSRLVPEHAPDGTIRSVLNIARDVTARRAAEAALRESERALALAQRIARLGSWELDLANLDDVNSNPLRWSDETFRIFGFEPNAVEVSNEVFFKAVHYEDRERVAAGIAELLRTGTPYSVDHRIILPDGVERIVHEDAQVVLDDTTKRFVKLAGTVRDITEQRQMEAEREQMHQQLVKASRKAGMAEVATSVLHNVGNVLNSVNLSATIATDKIRQGSGGDLSRVAELFQQHRENLPQFLTSAQGAQLPKFLAALAQHLADEQQSVLQELQLLGEHIEHIKIIVAAQQSHARLAAVIETLSPASVVDEALLINAHTLDRHGIVLLRDFHASSLLDVDKHKVLQILVNLISNAKNAMCSAGASGKRLAVRIRRAGPAAVTISVSDEGEGIPAENLTRIFAHGFTTRKEGHGFGLHSAALAAREMGGSLTVQSGGEGQGATFTLTLPLRPPNA